MVIIGIVSFPTESAPEMGKRFGKLPPLPAYMTLKGPYFCGEEGVGTKAMSIFEFDQSKTREAMEYVATRFATYIGVPGYTYSTKIWLESKEALKLIGLA